jgi:hypothetical protein
VSPRSVTCVQKGSAQSAPPSSGNRRSWGRLSRVAPCSVPEGFELLSERSQQMEKTDAQANHARPRHGLRGSRSACSRTLVQRQAARCLRSAGGPLSRLVLLLQRETEACRDRMHQQVGVRVEPAWTSRCGPTTGRVSRRATLLIAAIFSRASSYRQEESAVCWRHRSRACRTDCVSPLQQLDIKMPRAMRVEAAVPRVMGIAS